jgi:HD-like signal output (HDOD) protein
MQKVSYGQLNILRSLFDDLKEKDIAALFSIAKIEQLSKGQRLVAEGAEEPSFVVILDGAVQIVRHLSGHHESLASLSKGDWLGDISFGNDFFKSVSAIVLKPTKVIRLGEAALATLPLETQLVFFKRLNKLATQRMGELIKRRIQVSAHNEILLNAYTKTNISQHANYSQYDIIKGILKKAPRLPVFASTLAHKLLDERISPMEVAQLVKEDPSLVAIVLKTINSSYYGFTTKIVDINHAVVMLGINELYQIVINVGIQKTMPDTKNFNELRAHSSAISHLAFSLALNTHIDKPAHLATIGLMHELGQSVIYLLKNQNPKLSFLVDYLDQDQLGALLLKEWKLPEVVWQVVAHQSYPMFAGPDHVAKEILPKVTVLYLSHLCLEYLQTHRHPEDKMIMYEGYMRTVGLEPLALNQMIDKYILPTLLKSIQMVPPFLRNIIKTYLQQNKTDPSTKAAAA